MFEIVALLVLILIIIILFLYRSEIYKYAEKREKEKKPMEFVKMIKQGQCPSCEHKSKNLFRITNSESNNQNVFIGCENCKSKFHITYNKNLEMIAKEVGKC